MAQGCRLSPTWRRAANSSRDIYFIPEKQMKMNEKFPSAGCEQYRGIFLLVYAGLRIPEQIPNSTNRGRKNADC